LPQRAVGLGPGCGNPVQSVAVGASISAAVTVSGETYLWGYGIESATPSLVQGLKGKAGQKVSVGSNGNIAFLTGSSAELFEWQFDGAALDAEETHGAAAGEGGDDAEYDTGHHAGGKGTPTVNVNLRGKRLVAMSSGKNHYVVVTADGKCYAWGSNYLHECGLKLPGDISYVPHPLEMKIKAHIVDVKCGVEHSIALSSTGQVYTWGTGCQGRTGHISNADVPEPRVIQTLVDANIIVQSTAIGPNNCAVVTNAGHVYMWGAGNGGQIGNGDLMPAFKPVLIKALLDEKVVQVALGNYHACCLTEKKTVYTWGDNKFGQLGLYPAYQEDHAAYPQPVDALNMLQLQPSHIECGDNVCMVLTGGGELYGWGTGETMQLCQKDAPMEGDEAEEDFSVSEDVPSPVRLQFPFQKPGNGQA
jgi:alpha-tubulin suppressor-like RCC1 family protein